jgi:chromosome segregation ATPase
VLGLAMSKVSDLVRTVSDFPWASGPKLTPDGSPEPAVPQTSTDRPANPDPGSFADVGARIGADNEVLRNLLIDTGHQLAAIDDLKQSFSKLVKPLNNVLTTLEHERAEHARSQGELMAIRSNHSTLRDEFQGLEVRSSELKTHNERLNKNLSMAMQKARELEDERSELKRDLAAARGSIATMTKQLGEESTKVRVLSEEKIHLIGRADTSDQKITGLEGELAQARERISLLENDKVNLQASLDKTLAESSRLSRVLTETESALAHARNKLEQTESSLAATEAERIKLVATLDEANERRQSEIYALELKLDGMRSRSETAEQMAASARQSLIGRSETLRAAEARLFDANIARNEAETKAEHLTAVGENQARQIEKLENDVVELTERCRTLLETQTANEISLADAHENIASLTRHLDQVQTDATAYRTKAEEDFAQLSAAIEQERTERSFAEAALNSTRKDYARLQQQTTQERSEQRTDQKRRAPRG